MMRIDVPGKRSESAVGHPHSNGRRMLERIGHGKKQNVHQGFLFPEPYYKARRAASFLGEVTTNKYRDIYHSVNDFDHHGWRPQTTPGLTDEREANTSSQFGRSSKFLCSPEE
jgi:hypothetical protein